MNFSVRPSGRNFTFLWRSFRGILMNGLGITTTSVPTGVTATWAEDPLRPLKRESPSERR